MASSTLAPHAPHVPHAPIPEKKISHAHARVCLPSRAFAAQLSYNAIQDEGGHALIKGLRGLGAPEAESRLTLYDDAPAPVGWPTYFGHASTIPAYATEELYSWMLGRVLGT